MDNLLLTTKLRVPPQTFHIVHRARLIQAIESGIPAYKIILISAPAGYGKTTLLAEWARASRHRIAWLSLGAEDNDLQRFLHYLAAAWEKVQPGIRETSLGVLFDGASPDSQAVLSAIVNTANELPDPLVFVLDDVHLVEDPSIHQALAFLLDHLPPALHFVIAGRGEPPLPLARYRARHSLLEFRTEDLSFLPEETDNFLNETMQLDLPPAQVQNLHDQLEGWIAGLQLAALTFRRRPAGSGPPAISGKVRFIADYLSEDVLAYVPEAMRRFLLYTSILDRLCGPLCDAVCSGTNTVTGQAMLETLERENLFLVPLDDSREWFRYHRLFADFLRAELNRQYPAEIAGLHRRAAGWYFEHDQPELAFRHAVGGGDVERVIEIAQRYLLPKLLGGEIAVVKGWLKSLPEEWVAGSAELGYFQAALLFFTGQFDACSRYLDDLERRARAGSRDVPEQLARVTAVRCFIACYHKDLEPAEAFARQALRDLPEDELTLRRGLYGSLGDTYREVGRWQEARDYYRKLLELPQSPDMQFYLVHVYGALADLDLRQGRLREAAGNWRKALAVIQRPEMRGKIPLPLIGWVYIRMGEFLYEWNERVSAWEHLAQGLERAELGGDVRALIAGTLIACRLKLTEGDTAAASGFLERARPLLEQAPFPDWTSRFERLQLEFWLAQGLLRPAVDWARGKIQAGEIAARPENEAAALAAARVLIVKGDPPSLEQAHPLLARLRAAAEAEGRKGVLIEALALQALAGWARGDRPRAMTAIEHALRLAEPEGYVRLFADLGLPMARLLQEARSRAVLPDYIHTLLAAFAGAASAPSGPALAEPLTTREQEVLERIAAGLNNREIAEALVISPETVKKHLASIYGKLGVSSRTQAVARARELALFE